MIFYYINDVDRSSDVSEGTLSANNQLQQRSDQAQFEMRNTQPGTNEPVAIYFGDQVASAAGATIVLKGYFETETAIFYAGQELRLRPKQSNEETVTVLSWTESTLTLVLTAAPTVAPVAGDQIGQMVFAGFIAKVQDKNLQTIDNLLWDVTAVDYSKLFDAKIVTNSWTDVDARYIINDFVNEFVNYNATLDEVSYPSNASLTAVWAKVGGTDANTPTTDTSTFVEGIASGTFEWTHTGAGSAAWTATIVATDVSDLVGASHGQPNAGRLMVWPDFSSINAVSAFKIQIGSSPTNYLEVPFTLPTASNDFYYLSENLGVLTPVGDPNWRSVTYLKVVITETFSANVKINGIRVNSDSAFTLRQLQKTTIINDYRASQVKAAELINRLAKAFDFAWYIDYDLDLFFAPMETVAAPFDITDNSNNFFDLRITTDASNIGNRIIVNGGIAPSLSTYAQVFPTDGALREWVLQAAPGSLSVLIDDGSGTKTTEVGTNTTNIKITSHGFAAGDHIVNTTRGNVVREVLTVVDANNFTVLAVPLQTSGDTISYFNVTKTAGFEGVDDEAEFDYMYSTNSQSVRASAQTNTIASGQFIRFSYTEMLPIIVQYADGVSVSALKAMGLGNGVFDLAPITDPTIVDSTTALLTAQAQVHQFSNAVINGSFKTDKKGLRAGQLLTINQETQRNFNNVYLIQKVSYSQHGGRYQDYVEFTVTFGTTLFGFIELMQKALRRQNNYGADTTNTEITLIVSGDEDITGQDSNTVAIDGINQVNNTETSSATDSNIEVLTTPAWEWEPSVGQTLPTRWNLFEWF